MRTIIANFGSFDDELARNSRWLLAGVVLLAISVRMWGIDFGLPYLYHSDEPGYVAIAQNIFKTGDLNPHFFNYPSLFFYVNAIAQIPYYLVGKLAGVFQSPVDIPVPTGITTGVGWTPMPTTFLLGRTLTALFGSAVVVPVFLAGQKLTDSTGAGLLAALMTAISPTNVANSRLITPDTFVVFFASLSFWGSVQVYSQGKLWHYIVAGVTAGLTASAKYNGALIVLSLILAHFLRFGLRACLRSYVMLHFYR